MEREGREGGEGSLLLNRAATDPTSLWSFLASIFAPLCLAPPTLCRLCILQCVHWYRRRCVYVSSMCVGEWSGRRRSRPDIIHRRRRTDSLVVRQWRSRVGRRLLQRSRSTAEQSTTTTTRPRRRRPSVSNSSVLRWTYVTTLCRSRQQPWHHLSIQPALSAWLIAAMTHNILCRSYQLPSPISPI